MRAVTGLLIATAVIDVGLAVSFFFSSFYLKEIKECQSVEKEVESEYSVLEDSKYFGLIDKSE